MTIAVRAMHSNSFEFLSRAADDDDGNILWNAHLFADWEPVNLANKDIKIEFSGREGFFFVDWIKCRGAHQKTQQNFNF